MTNKAIISLLLVATTILSVSADAMRDIATTHLGTRITKVWSSPDHTVAAFNRANGGFVIATADRIIGYSDNGIINAENLPDALKEMLQAYPSERRPVRVSANVEPVAPLLGEIAWDQTHPYNLLCPTYLGSARSATGCAATAMAQIMRYHQYPAKGQGTHSYQPESYPKMGTITVNFSQSTYDWAHMTPQYNEASTQTETDAVARLMFDAGVAISMNYGPQSGALSQDWPEALVKYFAYDEGVALRFRANYELEDWNKVIYDELRAGRPVYATGFTSAGGHAFVFDGCDSQGMVHVNWGWSAMSNGYFDTTLLSPATQGTGGSSGGFNSRQMIVTGIMPPQGEASGQVVTIVSEEGLTAPKKATLQESVTVRLNGKIENPGWQDATADFALWLVDADGKPVSTFNGPQGIAVPRSTPHRNLVFENVTMDGVAPGSYHLMPMACASGTNRWERVRDKDTAYPNYLIATVTDQEVAYTTPEMAGISAKGLTVDGKIYSGMKCRINATIANEGQSEYYGPLTPALLDPATGRTVEAAESSVFDIMPGKEESVEIFATFSSAPGRYMLTLIDYDSRQAATPVEIEILDGGESVLTAVSAPDFGNNDAVNPLEINVISQVGCGSGLFSGHIFIYFYCTDGETVAGCIGPEFVQISDGNTATVTFTGRFENGRPGQEYDACIVNGEAFTFVSPREIATTRFRVADDSAISETINDSYDSETRFYNLQGTRLPDRPTQGIYIEVSHHQAKKIIATKQILP